MEAGINCPCWYFRASQFENLRELYTWTVRTAIHLILFRDSFRAYIEIAEEIHLAIGQCIDLESPKNVVPLD